MKKTCSGMVLIFVCLVFLHAQERAVEKVELTLKDCLLKALDNNLDIAVQAVDPEISSFSLRHEKDIYWPQLRLGYFNYN